MLHKIVFEDEITLWWECFPALPDGGSYKLLVNGKNYGKTTKTHYELKKLQADETYDISVLVIDGNGELIAAVGSVKIKTLKRKIRLDVTKAPYFAVGDGVKQNTAAIQRALDDCGADDCVYFPKGVYMTGALNVRSDTEIYLDKGAVLQGYDNLEDYLPKCKSRFEGIETECYRSLLNLGELDRNGGYNCKNVAFRGEGTISGGGKVLALATIEAERERLKTFLADNVEYIKTCENEDTVPGRARGRLLHICNSQNVVMSGITMQYGPAWNVHMIYSKDIITCGCKIISEGVWNGDGWDPDSSENCIIFNTEFKTHDDAIAIKSGKNLEGNIINRPTKNVYIFDCFGRNCIAIGSEMSGGVEGVYIWDCDFSVAYSGLHIKTTKKRGGYIRDVCAKNSSFASLSVLTALNYNNDGEGSPALPKIKNISLENVSLTGVRTYSNGRTENLDCIELCGLQEAEYHLENIKLKNISLCPRDNDAEHTFKIKNVKNLTFENVNYKSDEDKKQI